MSDSERKPESSGGPHYNLNDPRNTLIVVGENGKLYKLTGDQWIKDENIVTDQGEAGLVNQLVEFGTYLAFIRDDIAVGAGFNCTLVNLKAILQDNPHAEEKSRNYAKLQTGANKQSK